MLLELTAKINLHLMHIHLESTSLRMHSSTLPYGKTWVITNDLDHLELSFPGNNFYLELNSKTCCPGFSSLCIRCLSCHALVFSL